MEGVQLPDTTSIEAPRVRGMRRCDALAQYPGRKAIPVATDDWHTRIVLLPAGFNGPMKQLHGNIAHRFGVAFKRRTEGDKFFTDRPPPRHLQHLKEKYPGTGGGMVLGSMKNHLKLDGQAKRLGFGVAQDANDHILDLHFAQDFSRVYVAYVSDQARKAGLALGDFVLSINEERPKDEIHASELLNAACQAGAKDGAEDTSQFVRFEVLRKGSGGVENDAERVRQAVALAKEAVSFTATELCNANEESQACQAARVLKSNGDDNNPFNVYTSIEALFQDGGPPCTDQEERTHWSKTIRASPEDMATPKKQTNVDTARFSTKHVGSAAVTSSVGSSLPADRAASAALAADKFDENFLDPSVRKINPSVYVREKQIENTGNEDEIQKAQRVFVKVASAREEKDKLTALQGGASCAYTDLYRTVYHALESVRDLAQHYTKLRRDESELDDVLKLFKDDAREQLQKAMKVLTARAAARTVEEKHDLGKLIGLQWHVDADVKTGEELAYLDNTVQLIELLLVHRQVYLTPGNVGTEPLALKLRDITKQHWLVADERAHKRRSQAEGQGQEDITGAFARYLRAKQAVQVNERGLFSFYKYSKNFDACRIYTADPAELTRKIQSGASGYERGVQVSHTGDLCVEVLRPRPNHRGAEEAAAREEETERRAEEAAEAAAVRGACL